MPNNHRSSWGDDRRWASTSLYWRRSCFRTVYPQELYAARGRQMTTRAHEVTTGDELQLHFARGGGGGVGWEPLTPGVVRCKGCTMTTGAHEVMTVDELQRLVEDSPGGGTLTSKGPYEYCVNWSFKSIHNGVCKIATASSPSTCLWEESYILL